MTQQVVGKYPHGSHSERSEESLFAGMKEKERFLVASLLGMTTLCFASGKY